MMGLPRIRELSLFSGIAGFTLGVKLCYPNIRTVGYVELEPYCQEVIKARIKDGFLDDAPIWDDICTFRGAEFRGLVDIITAGVPCQWISKASGKKPAEDHPGNLWLDTLRVIEETRPNIIVLENPSNIMRYYYHVVRPRLSELGYTTKERLQAAVEVGAPHIRERFFVVAYTDNTRGTEPFLQQHIKGRINTEPFTGRTGSLLFVPDTTDEGLEKHFNKERLSSRQSWRQTESPICGVDDGTAHRLDRIRALGNAVVPAMVPEFCRKKYLNENPRPS